MAEYSVCYIMDKYVYSIVCSLANFAYQHPAVTLILSLIIASTLYHANLSKLLCSNYDYGLERGPHTWQASGSNQSPINIDSNWVEFVTIREQLIWNHFDNLPTKVTIENNGRTVILKALFATNVPTISGADLFHSYSFDSLCFHWSFSNTQGSEHTINHQTYAMEIQATYKTNPVLECLTNNHGLIIAYVMEVSAHNPYLDPVVLNLHRIRKPGTKIEIPAFPLAWLCYSFKPEFYSYGGSNTTPPCEEGVEWFINGEPMTIAQSQLMEFRALLSLDGQTKIIRNSRPVQCLNNNRIIQFNKYEGCYSSCDSQQQLSNVDENNG